MEVNWIRMCVCVCVCVCVCDAPSCACVQAFSCCVCGDALARKVRFVRFSAAGLIEFPPICTGSCS